MNELAAKALPAKSGAGPSSPAAAVGRSHKDEALEGVRGLAALTVVLAHSLYAVFPYLTTRRAPFPGLEPRTPLDSLLNTPPFHLLLVADAAVVVFFVLSGYVLTIKFYETRNTAIIQSAAARRYVRLILPAAVSVLFAWAILSSGLMGNHLAGILNISGWPLDYYKEPRTFLEALRSAFIGVPFYGDSYLNGVLWSIQVEFLGSMVLFASLAMFSRHSLVLVCVSFLFAAHFLTGGTIGILYYVAILSGFLIHPVACRFRVYPAACTVLAACGLYLVSVDRSADYAWLTAMRLPDLEPVLRDPNANRVLLWQTVGAWMLVAGVVGSPLWRVLFSMRLPVYLGRISFALYLLHFPLVMSLLHWAMYLGWRSGLGFVGYFTVAYVLFALVLWGLAEMFTRWIDVPSIRLAWRFDNWLTRSGELRPRSRPSGW